MAPTEITNAATKIAAHTDVSIFGLITSADIVSQIVMLILLAASVWSWAIILDKYNKYKKIKVTMAAFESVFWSGQALDALYERIKKSIDNPLSSVFVAAMS